MRKLSKKRSLPKLAVLLLAASLTLMWTSSCANPLASMQAQGNVKVYFNVNSRTVESDLSTQMSLFHVIFSNTDGEEVMVETEDTVVEAALPALGTWDITVDGFNENLYQVAQGTGSIHLESGSQESVAIKLQAIDGDGTSAFQLQWNPVQVRSPAVTAELVDTSGQAVPLTFTLNGDGTAESTGSVAAGFYTLHAQLLDDGVVVAGVAEVVQILAGGTSQQLFSFDSVNKPGVVVSVDSESFTVEWNEVIDAETGEPLTVTGYRLYYREHGSYQWTEVDDTAAGVTSYTVDSTMLPPGDYELAVSALYLDKESDLHTSFDDTADPTYGWYVSWNY